MTSVVAWVSVDSRGQSGLYFASDSRITWPRGGKWEHCRKIFHSGTQPEIFGFCGDVIFPSQALSQIVGMIDSGWLYNDVNTVTEKFSRVVAVVKSLYRGYPISESADYEIIHGFREGSGNNTKFSLGTISWSTKSGFTDTLVEIADNPKPFINEPQYAGTRLIVAKGSGVKAIRAAIRSWEDSDVGGTSRAIFSGFCQSIESGADSKTGGAPQLCGLYRGGHGRALGVVSNGKRYIAGMPVEGSLVASGIEWRNSNFERCDPSTGDVKSGAQRQPAPGNVSKN